jgi:GxxExxY protein
MRLPLRAWRLGEGLYWLEMSENVVAKQIVDAAYRVHTTPGPGLLESVYQAALAYELEKRGLRVARQQAIPVVYEAVRIDSGFHADLVVEDKVIVEIKAVETIASVHKKQLLTYLKLADKRLGLLINFNVALIKTGLTPRRQRARRMISHKDARTAKKPNLPQTNQCSH